MASTKLYLDLRKKAKDGRGSIVIILSNRQTTTSIRTGVRVLPSEWNGSHVTKRADAAMLNIKLAEIKNGIDMQIIQLSFERDISKLTAPQLKAVLVKKEDDNKGCPSVSMMFDEYLEQDLSAGTKGLYLATRNKVEKYAGQSVLMEDINYKWLKGFEKFLAKTRGVNGRAIDLRNLRAVCNYAVNTGAISDYAFQKFPIKQEPTKKRSISIDKLRELYRFPCSQKERTYRDYFFLMFYLIGINAKDLFLAKPSVIIDGRLEYSRSKTGKRYSIKIEPEAAYLLKKYRGKKYLVEVSDHFKDYKNFLHDMNDALGMIGPVNLESVRCNGELFNEPVSVKKVEPIIPELTSYYARHTWATLAYEIGIPIDIISQALGHSIGNKTTLIYIKPDQSKVDAANRKVIDYFFEI